MGTNSSPDEEGEDDASPPSRLAIPPNVVQLTRPSVVGPFDKLNAWLTGIQSVHMVDGAPADQIGAVREQTYDDGKFKLWEPLKELDHERFYVRYGMLEPDDDHPVKLSPHPTFPYNYDASITLHQITESEQPQTFLEFSAEYDCDAAKAQDKQAAITTVFREGFEQLNMMLGN